MNVYLKITENDSSVCTVQSITVAYFKKRITKDTELYADSDLCRYV